MQVIYILSPSCVFWIVLTMSMEIMVNSCLRVNPLPFDHYLEEQNANWETNQIDNYHSEVSSYMLEYFYKLFHLLINIILFFQCQNKAFLTDYTFILFFWFYASDVNIRKICFWLICLLSFQYTDEEVERSYEEFYEDVHTEFLKFGEIVNFKVVNYFL